MNIFRYIMVYITKIITLNKRLLSYQLYAHDNTLSIYISNKKIYRFEYNYLIWKDCIYIIINFYGVIYDN